MPQAAAGNNLFRYVNYRGADKSLARPGRKQAIYNHNWGNISTIYIYNNTSTKQNILTIK
jgi:hypothetical protein